MAKKYIFAFLIAVLMMPAAFLKADGTASLNFSPAFGSYKTGQEFSISINVDPGSGSVDTVRAKFSYPVDLLQVEKFSTNEVFSYQAGANSFDNQTGTFSWGAGVPGGIKVPQKFGTIVFKAIKDGSAKITLSSGTLVLSAGQNVFNNQLSSASFSVLPVTASSQKTTVKKATPAKNLITTAPPEKTEETNTVNTQIIPQSAGAASLANSWPFLAGLKNWIFEGILFAIAIIILGFILYKARENEKSEL